MYLFGLEFSSFLDNMPRSGIAGSYGNSIFSFLQVDGILIPKDVLVAFIVFSGGVALFRHLRLN